MSSKRTSDPGASLGFDIVTGVACGETMLVDCLINSPGSANGLQSKEFVENISRIISVCHKYCLSVDICTQACTAECAFAVLHGKIVHAHVGQCANDIIKIVGGTNIGVSTVSAWSNTALRMLGTYSYDQSPFFSVHMLHDIMHAFFKTKQCFDPANIETFAHCISSSMGRRYLADAYGPKRSKVAQFDWCVWDKAAETVRELLKKGQGQTQPGSIADVFASNRTDLEDMLDRYMSISGTEAAAVEQDPKIDLKCVFQTPDFTPVFAERHTNKRLKLRTFENGTMSASIANLTSAFEQYRCFGLHRCHIRSLGGLENNPCLHLLVRYIAEINSNMRNGPHSCSSGKHLRKEFNALTSPGFNDVIDRFMFSSLFSCNISTRSRGRKLSPERIEQTLKHLNTVNAKTRQLTEKTFKYFLPHGVQKSCCHLNTLTSRVVCIGIATERSSWSVLMPQTFACFVVVDFARHITEAGRHPGHGLVGLAHDQFHLVSCPSSNLNSTILGIQKSLFKRNNRLTCAKKLISHMLEKTTMITMAMKPCGLTSLHGGLKNCLESIIMEQKPIKIHCHGFTDCMMQLTTPNNLVEQAVTNFVYQTSENTTRAQHLAFKVAMQKNMDSKNLNSLPMTHPAAITPTICMFDDTVISKARAVLDEIDMYNFEIADIESAPLQSNTSPSSDDESYLLDLIETLDAPT